MINTHEIRCEITRMLEWLRSPDAYSKYPSDLECLEDAKILCEFKDRLRTFEDIQYKMHQVGIYRIPKEQEKL